MHHQGLVETNGKHHCICNRDELNRLGGNIFLFKHEFLLHYQGLYGIITEVEVSESMMNILHFRKCIVLFLIILFLISCDFPPSVVSIISVKTSFIDNTAGTINIEFNWLDSAYVLKEITIYQYVNDDWYILGKTNNTGFSGLIENTGLSYNTDFTEEGYKYKYTVHFEKNGKDYFLENEVNIWIPIHTDIVWYTDTGEKYHRYNCRYLYSRHPATRTEALLMGLTACSVCRP